MNDRTIRRGDRIYLQYLYRKDQYKVVIACYKNAREYYHKKLLSIIDADNVARIFSGDISFKNGSLIRFISPSEDARGHKAHLLIVEDGICDDILHQVLRPIETLKYVKDETTINKKGGDNYGKL